MANRRSFVFDKLNFKKTPASVPSSPLSKSLSIGTIKDVLSNKSDLDIGPAEKTFHELEIQIEYANIASVCPRNIYCIAKGDDYYCWYGVIFIPNKESYGSYKKGVFEFSIELTKNYPKTPPALKLKTEILHPSIDQRGNVKLFKWDSQLHFIHHVLTHIDSIFREEYLKNINVQQVLNRDAYNMYQKENSIFKKLVSQCVSMSTLESNLFRIKEKEEKGLVSFKPISEQKYEDLKAQVTNLYK